MAASELERRWPTRATELFSSSVKIQGVTPSMANVRKVAYLLPLQNIR